jgi:aminopeptidase N
MSPECSLNVPSQVRRWKAAAILLNIERKMGEDSFRKVVQQVVQRASLSLTQGLTGPYASARLVSTSAFLRICRKVGGLQHAEVAALTERWITGSACPTIKVRHASLYYIRIIIKHAEDTSLYYLYTAYIYPYTT